MRALQTFLTHDFCPNLNRYVYWLKHPLALLALAAVGSLSIGVFVSPQGYWLFGGLSIVIALGIFWPLVAMRAIRVSLRFEARRCTEGETVNVLLTVHNAWPFAVWGLSLQHGFDREDEAESLPVLALARVPGWSQTEYRWQFKPSCRGEYPLQVPSICTAFPFGLYSGQATVHVERKLLVWPRRVKLPAMEASAGSRCQSDVSIASGGSQGEVVGTRPYRAGDSLRHVHWSLSAKHDRLVIRERQLARSSKTRIEFDLSLNVNWGRGANSSREWIIRLAASAASTLLAQQETIDLVVDGRTVFADASPRYLPLVLDFLARLNGSDAQTTESSTIASRTVRITTDRGLACACGREALNRGDLLIVLTDKQQLPLGISPDATRMVLSEPEHSEQPSWSVVKRSSRHGVRATC